MPASVHQEAADEPLECDTFTDDSASQTPTGASDELTAQWSDLAASGG